MPSYTSREPGRGAATAADPHASPGTAPGKRTLTEGLPGPAGAPHHAAGRGAAPRTPEAEAFDAVRDSAAVDSFVDALAYYTDPGFLVRGRQGPPRIAVADPTLDALAERVRGAVFILENDSLPDRSGAALALWTQLRDEVQGVLAAAPGRHADPSKVAAAAAAVHHFEAVLVGDRAAAAVAQHTGAIDVGSPEAGYLKAAGKSVDEALMKGGELLGKAKDLAVASFGEDPRLEAGASGFELVYGLAVEAPDLVERLEKAKEQGVLAQTATIFDLLKLSLGSLNKFLSVTNAVFATALKSKAGEEVAGLFARAAEAAEHNPIGTVTSVLGCAVNALGIVSSTLSLIDAVRHGDTRGALAAGHGIVQGLVGIGSTALKATAFEAGAASMTVFLWYEAVDMLGVLGGILDEFRNEARLERVGRFVELAAHAARDGQAMAQAADAALSPDRASGDPAMQAAVVRKIQATAEARARGVVSYFPRLAGFVHDFARDANFTDVVAALGPEALAILDPARPPALEPTALTLYCRQLFHGIDRMGRYAVDKFGDRRSSTGAALDRGLIGADVAAETAARR